MGEWQGRMANAQLPQDFGIYHEENQDKLVSLWQGHIQKNWDEVTFAQNSLHRCLWSKAVTVTSQSINQPEHRHLHVSAGLAQF